LKRPGWRFLWVLAATLLGVNGWATEKSPFVWKAGSEPLHVDSQSLEARGKEGLAVFEGDVVARQGDLALQADRLDVRLEPESREIQSVEARGRVRIEAKVEGQDVVATGERVTYDAGAGVLDLTGDPKVWRGRDVVAGDRIIFYLAEDRYVVEKPVMIIYPGQAGEKDDE
jgi:lipopolysaccharide export system protein LptA